MPNPGGSYVALTNISLPRENDADKMSDLVLRGETVILSAKRAEPFLRRTPPVLARAGSPEAQALLIPRQLSGRLQGPPVGTRPDPPGSSAIQVLQDAISAQPEGSEPAPGTENSPDALDLPPGTRVTSGV